MSPMIEISAKYRNYMKRVFQRPQKLTQKIMLEAGNPTSKLSKNHPVDHE